MRCQHPAHHSSRSPFLDDLCLLSQTHRCQTHAYTYWPGGRVEFHNNHPRMNLSLGSNRDPIQHLSNDNNQSRPESAPQFLYLYYPPSRGLVYGEQVHPCGDQNWAHILKRILTQREEKNESIRPGSEARRIVDYHSSLRQSDGIVALLGDSRSSPCLSRRSYRRQTMKNRLGDFRLRVRYPRSWNNRQASLRFALAATWPLLQISRCAGAVASRNRGIHYEKILRSMGLEVAVNLSM